MGSALRFRQPSVPRQQGELVRLKVVHGPDMGTTYVVVAQRAVIGRGEECDVMIGDLKASRRHAELSYGPTGWSVKDLGSSNGILHNGKNVKSANMRTGDSFAVGETTFEFITATEAGTQMLMAPGKSLAQLQAEQAALEEQRKRAQSFGKFKSAGTATPAASAPAGGPESLLKNKRAMIYGALGLLVAFVMLTPDKKPVPPKKKKEEPKHDARDIASVLPRDNSDAAKMAEAFFRTGFREYREGNYLRAKQQFETVLQIDPGHKLATLYMENADTAIEDEIKTHLERGKTDFDAGKLHEAKAHYEAILRFLYRDQTNPAFNEAKDQLEKVNKAIDDGGGPG